MDAQLTLGHASTSTARAAAAPTRRAPTSTAAPRCAAAAALLTSLQTEPGGGTTADNATAPGGGRGARGGGRGGGGGVARSPAQGGAGALQSARRRRGTRGGAVRARSVVPPSMGRREGGDKALHYGGGVGAALRARGALYNAAADAPQWAGRPSAPSRSVPQGGGQDQRTWGAQLERAHTALIAGLSARGCRGGGGAGGGGGGGEQSPSSTSTSPTAPTSRSSGRTPDVARSARLAMYKLAAQRRTWRPSSSSATTTTTGYESAGRPRGVGDALPRRRREPQRAGDVQPRAHVRPRPRVIARLPPGEAPLRHGRRVGHSRRTRR